MAGIESFNPLLYSQSTAALEAAKKIKKSKKKKKLMDPVELDQNFQNCCIRQKKFQ